jgi:hypothetical protein
MGRTEILALLEATELELKEARANERAEIVRWLRSLIDSGFHSSVSIAQSIEDGDDLRWRENR